MLSILAAESTVEPFSPQEMLFGAIFSIVQGLSMSNHAHAETLGCSAV
jgi:hypothetical protein